MLIKWKSPLDALAVGDFDLDRLDPLLPCLSFEDSQREFCNQFVDLLEELTGFKRQHFLTCLKERRFSPFPKKY